MQQAITITLVVLTLVAFYGYQQVECSTRDQIPPLFDDVHLPVGQRDGQYIENLGHILKLDTYMPPKQIENYLTKLTLHNRQMARPKEFIFKPKHFCIVGSCHGPFQYDLAEMADSGFDPNLKTIVMIPGFLTNDDVPWMYNARESWLQLEDVNVILVTWKNSNRYLYSTAVADTPLVARQITIFLYYLAELHNRHLFDSSFAKSFHFVAHSLGAHVAGFVGQDFGGRVGRITGLDPAGPSFDMMPRSRRLDSSDAKLVDVIHTNAGKLHYANFMASTLLKGTNYVLKKLPILGRVANYLGSNYDGEGDTAWYGIDAKVGHIDYYANNGRVQPGCDDLIHVCDHGRSTCILQDILQHEIKVKEFSSDRNSKRLMAFRSNNYEDYISGKSLAQNCPSLLDSTRQDASHDLQLCSLPLDFLSSVDELKAEFRSVYNLNLVGSNQESDSFFFSTSSERPLVNDQFLLKVGVKNWLGWDKSCALRIELSLDDRSMVVEFKEQRPFFKKNDFLGFAIPFISSENKRARSIVEQLTNTSSLSQFEDMFHILPQEISLTLSSTSSSKGLLASAGKTITKLLTFGYGKTSSQCRLQIESLEVTPLMVGQQVVASYSNFKHSNSIFITNLSNRDEVIRGNQVFHLSSTDESGLLVRLNTLMIG